MTGRLRISRRAMALVVVLSVLTLMLITVSSVALQGLGNLSAVRGQGFARRSTYAAEAAVAVGIHELVLDRTWSAGMASTPYGDTLRYALNVTNNLAAGGGTQTAPNGVEVPVGYVYLLGTGSRSDGSYPKQVGVMLSAGFGSSIPFAMASGGGIDLGGSKRVSGSLKSTGDLVLSGSTRVSPQGGEGRMLTSGKIAAGGSTSMDSSQDARAYDTISGVKGTSQLFPGDRTDDTLPFINDGRTDNTLLSGEKGLILPNPDRTKLLDIQADGITFGPNIVIHEETDVGTLDLLGKTHYFRNGINLTGGLLGAGTVVVDNGNTAEFQGINAVANIIVLRRPDQMPSGGNPSLKFKGNNDIRGLLFAHESIDIQGSFSLQGMMISYHGDTHTQGSFRSVYDPSILGTIPGFEPWATGSTNATGSGPVTLVSWERF